MKKHYCLVDKAWISYEGECNWCGEKDTSPRELSDEEIMILFTENCADDGAFKIIDFAKAILRKANALES